MKIRICEEAEYLELYNNRDYNPPDYSKLSKEAFDEEFWAVCESIGEVLKLRFSEYDYNAEVGDYTLHDGHNSTRFIDVAFENSNFLQEALLVDLQNKLRDLDEDWMVCLWFTNSMFVTQKEVILHVEDADEIPEWLKPRIK